MKCVMTASATISGVSRWDWDMYKLPTDLYTSHTESASLSLSSNTKDSSLSYFILSIEDAGGHEELASPVTSEGLELLAIGVLVVSVQTGRSEPLSLTS